MIRLDDNQQDDLTPWSGSRGRPTWSALEGADEPMNVQQEYLAQRRALENDRLAKLYTDEKEFARLSNESRMRESSRLSLLGEDLPKVALNAAYLSHRLGKKVTASEYEIARDQFAASQFGQEAVTDGQFFDLVKGEYDLRNRKIEAVRELRLRMAAQSLEDGVAGKITPAAQTWTAWREKHAELLDGEEDLPYLAASVADRNEFQQVVDKYKPLAAPGLALLQKFTAGEARQEELSDFARTLAESPVEDQDKVIDLIALAADGGQIDRTALKEFARSMGQTFSRGFNFIPQRGMQDAQLAFTEIQEVLETGDVWLRGSGEPTLTNVQRPGNTRPMQGVAAIDLRGRKATPEEIEQLKLEARGALDVLRIERQLRAVADNNVDPINRLAPKGTLLGALEGGVLGVAGSLPLLTATAVSPFAGMMAYQSMEFDRMLTENPDMSVRAAEGISLLEGAWQAALDRLQLKTLQGALPVTGRLLGQIKSTGLRRTLGFAASGVEQVGQELAQDIGTLAIDTVASALREDMQDKDFFFELGEYWKDAPEVLVSSLIFGMWGGGAITARELRGTPAEWDEAARVVGISEEGRRRMRAATTPEELDAVVERELKAVTPEARAAGALYAKAKAQAAAAQQADPNEPTLEVTKDQDGNSVYTLRTPDDQVLIETKDPQAAQAAFLDYRTAAENNEVQALREVIDYWQQRDPNLTIEQAPAVLVKDELDRLEGIGDAAGIERLRQRLVAADIDPDGDLTGVQIFGSASVQEVGENVYRGTIMVREGATPETVLEEVNHTFVKRALMRGDVTLDTLKGWLDQTAAATGLDIKRGNEVEIIESIAQVGMDLFNGRLDQAQIPQGLMDYFRRLMRVIKEIYVRAVKVTEAFDKGEIDANFESFLMESMGMSPQQQVDLNSTKTAAALVEDTGDPDWTVTEDPTRGPDGLTDDERAALEEELRQEMEQDAEEAAGEGGIDILDAVREAGGLPSKTSRRVYQYAGELKALRESQKPGNALGVKGVFNLFRKDAPDLDALLKDLRGMGFTQLETPSDLFEMLERRMRTERKIYGYEAAAWADYSIGRQSFKDWFGDWENDPANASKVVDENGRPLRVYHGTRRPDRVGNRFRKSRATSGPMAFFTANPEIGSSYAQGKADTSLEVPNDYAGWFKFKGKGMRSAVDIDRAWWAMSEAERETIRQRIYTVGYQNADEGSGPIVGDSSSIMGRESIDYELRQARGNALRALVEIWLNSGSLFNDEQTFMQVLEAAGMDMNRVTYDSPHAVRSAVYPVYLSIKNPLQTANIPDNVVAALEQAGKGKRAKRAAGANFDAWDKNNISGKDWVAAFRNDLETGSTMAWTRIPDWVTETLAVLGYDGIHDTGGKMGGEKHDVWIPFVETQVKSATGNRGTFDPTNPRIDYSLGRRTQLTFAEQLEELQAGESAPVDTSKTFWLIASSEGDIVDILDNEQDATEYFQTTASSGDWLWEYKNGLRTKVPLLKRGVAERRAEGYIDTVRYEQDEAQGRVLYYGADKSPETTTSAGEIPSHTPDGRVWAGQEESVVYHGGQNLDPQGTDPGGYGTTQTLKPRRPGQTYLFSLGRPRVDRALSAALNRKPGERLAMYERAKEMFDRVAARRGAETGSSGYARTLQSLWELDAILKVLPAEVRGKVGGFTSIAALEPTDLYRGDELVTESNSPTGAKIAAWMREGLNIGEAGKKTDLPPGYSTRRATDPARATKATDDFLVKRIATVGKQLDRYLAAEYRIAIERALEAAKPKRTESGVRRSTLGPETQAYADKALAASKLDNDQTAARLAAIEAELLNPETKDEAKIDLVEEWGLVNTLGDLEHRNAETLAQAYAALRDRLKAGRAGWRIQEEARIAAQRETAAGILAILGEPTKAKRFANKTQVQKLGELLTSAGLDHRTFEQFLRAVIPDEALVARWADMLRKADTGAQDMELAQRGLLLEAIQAAAKTAGMSRRAALVMLKKESPLKVRAMTGRKVEDVKISIELAEKIVRGTADRSNLSEGDVETLREALANLPPDTRKKSVTIQRVIFAGNPELVPLTPAQAMQLELSWDQPDVQDKMRREGWTDESIADIRAITSQPVVAEALAFLRKFYAENYATVNPVYARMFGMNMPQAKFYAPSRFLSAGAEKEVSLDGSPMMSGSTPGFAKARVSHSAPVAPEDALTVFQQHVAQSAHWVNFAEFAREARAVTNNLQVQEALRQRYGQGTVDTLKSWVELLEQRGGNKSREIAWLTKAFGSVLGGTAISSLGFNLKTVFIQLDSAMRFMLAMDPRQIGSALSDPIALAAAMPKVWFSPSVQRRLKGGMNPAVQLLFAREAAKPGPLSSLAWLAMQPIQIFDAAATTISSAMVFRASFNDAKAAGMPDAAAEAVALDAMDAAIYRYSQPTGFGSKSLMENTGNVFAKVWMLFLSDPRLKTGVLVDAVSQIGKGKNIGMNLQRIAAIEAMALVSHVIASAYRDAFSDDEDEDIWSVGGFAQALALAPLQGFFVVGTMSELALRKLFGEQAFARNRDPFINTAESAIRAAAGWEKLLYPEDAAEGLKAWNTALRGIAFSTPLGAPAALLNIIKPFIGFQENQEADE